MKKSTAKTKAKTAPVKMESSSHWIEGNIWFKLGLSKTEARMLKAVAARILTKPHSGYTARLLLQSALAHYDVIEPLIFNDARYSEKEGFLNGDSYLKGLIALQCAKIASPKKVHK